MRISPLFLLAAGSLALAACADTNPVSSRTPAQRFAVSADREVYVDAETFWMSSGSGSAGYAKGLATPVGGGTSYVMGDVEANGMDGAYFLEQAGYTGKLDAFRYYSGCTIKWYADFRAVSTASTIYLANYPNAEYFLLRITC
ncbi:MAG TPA: hypothetical protein VFS20_01840 [Longimicrobium sp.]|nr:hypothetical protein [Longimicrobium sp.]